MQGHQNPEEIWTEYKLRNPDHIAPAPIPIMMHPVQIKRLIRKTKTDKTGYLCPVMNALFLWAWQRWTNNPPQNLLQFIAEDVVMHNENMLAVGRFLQAAYN